MKHPTRTREIVQFDVNTLRRSATAGEAKALSHPMRIRILQTIGAEALTNKELAERLAVAPGSTLYHLRCLLAEGFLEPGQERKGRRNSREIPYRSSGKAWALSFRPSDGDQSASEHGRAVGAALVMASLDGYWGADPADRFGETAGTLRLDESTLGNLQSRMHSLLSEFRLLQDDRQPAVRVFWAFYQDVSASQSSSRSSD